MLVQRGREASTQAVRRRRWSAATVALSVVLGLPTAADAGLLGDAAREDATRAALTTPGSETRIDTPSNDGHMVVYVPSDYDAARDWPLILC